MTVQRPWTGAAFPRAVLADGALTAAPRLLGAWLLHRVDGTWRGGRIVETEAYTQDDPASHSFGRRTPRNEPMFGPPGTAYVYLSYGVHHCFNVVTGAKGDGEAVLVRAILPETGVEQIVAARLWRGKPPGLLVNGPGKLCRGLGIEPGANGANLLARRNHLRLLRGKPVPADQIEVTPRIGITKAADWPRRFVWRVSP